MTTVLLERPVWFKATSVNIEAGFASLVNQLLGVFEQQRPEEGIYENIFLRMHDVNEFLTDKTYIPMCYVPEKFGKSLNWLENWQSLFLITSGVIYCWSLLHNKNEVYFCAERTEKGTVVFSANALNFNFDIRALDKINGFLRDNASCFMSIDRTEHGVQLMRLDI